MKHMNVQRLGQDMHDIIEYLDLKDVIAIGHSMGAATIFSYVNQFGCGKLKKIVAVFVYKSNYENCRQKIKYMLISQRILTIFL